jgi:adenosylcobinamide-GDP ribazoletransferase
MSLPVEDVVPPRAPDAVSPRARGAAGRALRDLLLAFQFLTRLPAGKGAHAGDLGRSCAWFPLPGYGMGLLVAGAARLAAPHLSAPLAAVLAVAALAWLTGGLHLDGVADVFDGLGGGQGDRERTLRIMRDSRIGALGATALVLVLALKVAAVSDLFSRGSFWPLVVAPAVARFAVVPLVVLFPYARAEGLGLAFRGTAGRREIAVAALLAAAAIAPFAPASLLPAAVALAAAAAVALSVNRRLGGLTGDVYGASIELAEAALLAAATLR